YLGRGEPGIAKAIYRSTLKLQALISLCIVIVGGGLVFVLGRPDYWIISSLLILNVAPRMIGFIPSQANVAAESMKGNTKPAALGALATIVLTLTTLYLGWDLTGVALCLFAGTLIETVFKLKSAAQALGPAAVGTINPELRRRLITFSGQGLALMLL